MDGRRATGVSYRRGNEYKQARLNPRGEVRLSGGAVNSPRMLMLSGIGAAEELKEHGIPVVHDLPAVGKNLHDHLDITLMNAATSRKPIGVALSFLPRGVAGLFSYIFRRKGFLTSNVAESGGFVKSTPERDRPNLQFHFPPDLSEPPWTQDHLWLWLYPAHLRPAAEKPGQDRSEKHRSPG